MAKKRTAVSDGPRILQLPDDWTKAFKKFSEELADPAPLLVGLDPGYEGGFSVMRQDWSCYVLPTPYVRIVGATKTRSGADSKKHRVDYARWADVLRAIRDREGVTTLVFEDLVGYQLGLGTNISVGTLLGQQDGFLRGFLWESLSPDRVRLAAIKPQAWKRRFKLAGKKLDKAEAYASAAALLRELVHARSEKHFPDSASGVVDAALLLAHWRLENGDYDAKRLDALRRYGISTD